MGSPNLVSVYESIDLPLIPVFVEMETSGVLIDKSILTNLSPQIQSRQEFLQSVVGYIARGPINLESTAQVSSLLYDILGLPILSKKKMRSTDKEALESLRPYHPIIPYIQEYRTLSKLRSAFVDNLPSMVREDGRIHATFNNTAVETGRTSCKEPNLQQIPTRIPLTASEFIKTAIKSIRQAFVSRPGWSMLAADQEAVEWRILVSLAGEPAAIDALIHGKDPHLTTLSAYTRRPYEELYALRKSGDPEVQRLRELAKTVNYGLAYGQTGMGLSEWGHANGLPMTPKEAEEVQLNILGAMPRVERFINESKRKIARAGYAETHYGRRILYPDVKDHRRWVVEKAQREGMNAIIQGTAADVMKMILSKIWVEKERRGLRSTFWAVVHDEVDMEVPDSEVAEMAKLIEKVGPSVFDGPVPLTMKVGSGPSWGDAK